MQTLLEGDIQDNILEHYWKLQLSISHRKTKKTCSFLDIILYNIYLERFVFPPDVISSDEG